jgi:hypothetical protein
MKCENPADWVDLSFDWGHSTQVAKVVLVGMYFTGKAYDYRYIAYNVANYGAYIAQKL